MMILLEKSGRKQIEQLLQADKKMHYFKSRILLPHVLPVKPDNCNSSSDIHWSIASVLAGSIVPIPGAQAEVQTPPSFHRQVPEHLVEPLHGQLKCLSHHTSWLWLVLPDQSCSPAGKWIIHLSPAYNAIIFYFFHPLIVLFYLNAMLLISETSSSSLVYPQKNKNSSLNPRTHMSIPHAVLIIPLL